MTADLKAMAKDVAQHRDEIIERMVNFSLTDTLLFRNPDAEDLIAEERQVWDPIVEWAKKTWTPILRPARVWKFRWKIMHRCLVCRFFRKAFR